MAVATNELTNTAGIQLKKDAFVIIVKTEWNAHVVDILEEGCVKILKQHDVIYKIIEVPGAFEIPFAVNYYMNEVKKHLTEDVAGASIKLPDAFIALGCVIRGDTPHFEYVCQGVTQGMMQLNVVLEVPIINGVLTVNDQMQADERTGGRSGHKGEECAAAAIKMIALMESIKK